MLFQTDFSSSLEYKKYIYFEALNCSCQYNESSKTDFHCMDKNTDIFENIIFCVSLRCVNDAKIVFLNELFL